MIREVEFSQTGTFQWQPVCSRCVELTLSRRWATCPLLLDSMKVARHTRATYGVLGGGGEISRQLHLATSDQAGTGGRFLVFLKKMLIFPKISSFMSHNRAHASQDVRKVGVGWGGGDWRGVEGG